MTFDELNLNTPLLNALKDLGMEQPTTIQAKAFSVIMSGKDVLGIAQTGTGKTFAYLLPCLRLWKFNKETSPEILIIVPTRELVVQVAEEAEKLCKYMSIKIAPVYGGVNMKPQIELINEGVHIVVATPGRLLDLVLQGTLQFKSLKRLIIDEVDEMLDLGFRPQLERVLDLLPIRRQNLLFSATITDDVEKLIDTFFNNPIKIEAAPSGTALENIVQSAYLLPNFYTKINLLKHLFVHDDNMEKVLVFTTTKHLADEIYAQLSEEFGYQLGVVHSNKSQNQRFNTVKDFKNGNCRILIATDIVARGIDISEVTCVINFDTPEIAETYMHRIGRTGRADKKGISYTFITPNDSELIENIEALMNQKININIFPEGIVISDILTENEKPKIQMKNQLGKAPKRDDSKSGFHEKSAKNKKVNVRVAHADKMWEKYGRPLTRGQKGKKKK
jgi:ATP-dependent RNA helicase RhlE